MTERQGYRKSEVCRMLGINASTLWRWGRAGKIRFVKIGGIEFVPADVLAPLLGNNLGNKNAAMPRNAPQSSAISNGCAER